VVRLGFFLVVTVGVVVHVWSVIVVVFLYPLGERVQCESQPSVVCSFCLFDSEFGVVCVN